MQESRASRTLLIGLAVLGVLGRLPLLFGGYGTDPDAWRNAVAALRMHVEGRYIPSRIPGFPVYEGLLFLVSPLGWIATNAVSIGAGLLAALFLVRIARRLGLAHAAWIGLALLLAAPMWVRAAQTMDYAVGILFLLAAYEALLTGNPLVAGFGFALAAGTRLTLGFLAGPAVLYLLVARARPRRMAQFAAAFLGATALVFLPVMLSPDARHLGSEFRGHVAHHHAVLPDLPVLVKDAAVTLFTKAGLLVLAAGLLTTAVRRFRRPPAPERPPLRLVPETLANPTPLEDRPSRPGALAFEAASIVVLAAFYLLIPYEPAYLLPVLPLGLLLLGRVLSRGWMAALAVAMATAVLVFPDFGALRVYPGRLIHEVQRREALQERTDRLAGLRPETPTVYLVSRFEVHRLLVRDRSLMPTEAGWAPFRASGVALWARNHTRGYASELNADQTAALAKEGIRVEPAPGP